MTSLRNSILFLAVIVALASCQAEPENIETQATGSLPKTAAGDCSPMSFGGTYVQNIALSASNYLEVQVNFSSPGDYEIKSDTVNGYSFAKNGTVSTTGTQTVRLMGNGIPLAAGTDLFNIKFDTSVCQASITVSAATAEYTFGNTAGICTGAIVAGSYLTGAALGASNTVTVNVNVTVPGAYTITTGNVNNISFSRSGTFTALGAQTVELVGTGTPSAAGTFTYQTAATGGCTFDVTVINPAGALATLTTTAATDIVCAGAVSGGNITNDGGSAITARGICYSTSANPTTANNVMNSGSGTGAFAADLTGLVAGTTYHVRAFATNSAGTAYGNDISFTTMTGCIPKIYVTGWHDVFDISGNIRTPKIWTNLTGTYNETPLPFTANFPAEANGIAVNGTDVYVAGKENSAATIWLNGVATALTPPATAPFFYEGSALAIFLSGTDVYTAGVYANKATVWKNGVETTLPSGTFQSSAHAVFVSGSDVYVAGWDYDISGSTPVMVATLWKNGVATALTNGANDASANAVFVSGSDVYVAGKDGNIAKLWKNGVAVPLPGAGSNRTEANAIFVSGTDVYVVGREDDGNSPNGYAKLWRNGVGSYLTTAGQATWARSVSVVGGEVFVVGSRATAGANIQAGVWRNGVFTPLTSGVTDGSAFGIVVK